MLENIEEIRSRLVSIKADFGYITTELDAISKNYQQRKQIPPCLFPERIVALFKDSFFRIERRFQYLVLLHNANELIQCTREMQRINSDINGLICMLNALETIVNQRAVSSNKQQSFGSESAAIEIFDYQKIYHAADALCYNIFDSIMGPSWFRSKAYFPLTLFGDKYAVLLPHNIVEIPSYDLCRNRFWGKVAHEIGHMKIYFERQKPSYTKTLESFSENLASWPVDLSPLMVQSQFIELLADSIGAYVCGPSALLSALSSSPLDLPLYSDDYAQVMPSPEAIDAMRELTHPPIFIRISLMQEILKEDGIDEKWMNPLAKYAKQRTIENQALYRYDLFLQTYLVIIKSMAPNIHSIVKKFCGKKAIYDSLKWEKSKELSSKMFQGNSIDATPIELINALWLLRKDSFKSTDLANFILNRRFEGKYFEISIEKMVDWYSKIKI
jgi:hypothetical protein